MKSVLLAYVLLAPPISLFVRFLSFYFDSLTLSFYRFAAGSVALLVLACWRQPGEVRRVVTTPRLLGLILVTALLSGVGSVLMVEGVADTNATTAALVGLLGLPLAIAAAMVVYADERVWLLRPRFWIGVAVALACAVGLALGVEGRAQGAAYGWGLLFLAAAVLIGCFTGLLQKELMRRSTPLAVGAVCASVSALLLLACLLIQGNPLAVRQAPWYAVLLLPASGVYGLAVGMALAFAVLRRVGLAVYRLANLAVPVFVGILAYLLLGESLTCTQIVFGLILIVACWQAVYVPTATSGGHQSLAPGTGSG